MAARCSLSSGEMLAVTITSFTDSSGPPEWGGVSCEVIRHIVSRIYSLVDFEDWRISEALRKLWLVHGLEILVHCKEEVKVAFFSIFFQKVFKGLRKKAPRNFLVLEGWYYYPELGWWYCPVTVFSNSNESWDREKRRLRWTRSFCTWTCDSLE